MWKKLIPKRHPPSDHERSNVSIPERPTAGEGTSKSHEHKGSVSSSSGSVLSSYSPAQLTGVERTRKKSQDRRLDPLGLAVLHEPEGPPILDIIFVHGLGGTSRQTWSKNRDPELFWPHKWLPTEPDIKSARILSFGYNAHFASSGPSTISRISDFAKDLLFAMRFSNNSEMSHLSIGERPLIFVVHSMGGLVVKKAYILGQNEDNYQSIISSIKSIVFLSTPHRGSNLAQLLNRILSVSIFNHTPKEYIAELTRNSPALEELNEQFRHVAPKLQIFSFYETLMTPIGPKLTMVLDKDSSILGYPGEISKPLNADHHHVCKYNSREDSNYISVRDVLKSLVSRSSKAGDQRMATQEAEDLAKVASILGISEKPFDDFTLFRDRWRTGTCDWITSNSVFASWMQDSIESRILWINALPGSGKSILTTYIIDLLGDLNKQPSYFYFKFDDQSKRSMASCLRSLAFQTAQQVPKFRRALIEKAKSGFKLDKVDGRTIWKRVFVDILFKIPDTNPVYWVIDAIDESDSPKSLIELFTGVASAQIPMKILLVSRQSPELRLAFERLASTATLDIIAIGSKNQDIQLYIEQEMDLLRASSDLKKEIIQKLLVKANGSFLWVTLALNEILQCYTPEDIEEALDGIPNGMEQLYNRMESSIARSLKPSHIALAKILLTWAACSRRPLEIQELSEALLPEISVFDLKHTIMETCGQFVVVDQSANKVLMVHETAVHFLTNTPGLSLSIDQQIAHENLFSKCIRFMDEHPQRRPSGYVDSRAFLNYAATSWTYHLRMCSPTSENVLNLLVKFLQGQYVLGWISTLARLGQLKELVHASKILVKYVQRRRKYDAMASPLLHRLDDLDLVELWATDMNKIVGKYSNILHEAPSAIYKLVPPFCAKDSMIYKQFGENDLSPSVLTVGGISSKTWDDNLAKIMVSPGSFALSIVCSEKQFAVLTSTNNVVFYDATTFEKLQVVEHGENILAMNFNHKGDQLATFGYRTTKLWNIVTGKVEFVVPCPDHSKATEIVFSSDDSKLVIGSTDRSIKVLDFNDIDVGWSILDDRILHETAASDRSKQGSPSCLTFNAELTHVAVSYRSFPLSVWRIEPPEVVGRCIRNPETKNWTWVNQMVWHPTSGDVLGRYMDGNVFRWHPYEGTHQEVNAAASNIACSPDGSLFATTDADGRLKLYSFYDFTQIYQLSTTYFSSSIAFSPDCKRIYDLQGQFCNVWEPNALIRLDNLDEHESEIDSDIISTQATSMVSEMWAETRESITAFALQSTKDFYAVGNEAGIVQIFKNGHIVSDLWKSVNHMMTLHLDWGEDGEYVAILGLEGRVVVQRLLPSLTGPAEKWKSETVLKFQPNLGRILQILLSTTSEEILICSKDGMKVWSVTAKAEITPQNLLTLGSPRKWINHPTDSRWLLSFDEGFVKVYRWKDFAEVAILTYSDSMLTFHGGEALMPNNSTPPNPPNTTELPERIVKRLFASPSKSHIVFQYSYLSQNQSLQSKTLIFKSSCFDNPDVNSPKEIFPVFLPGEVESEIEIPLNVLGKKKLAFLNKKHWICTWQLDNGGDMNTLRQHFFLPRDWLNSESMALCTMLGDGTFLCPKNGEIAIIKSSVASEW